MVDHTLNIYLAKRNALRKQLEIAKKKKHHNDITPLARELAKLETRIQSRLGN